LEKISAREKIAEIVDRVRNFVKKNSDKIPASIISTFGTIVVFAILKNANLPEETALKIAGFQFFGTVFVSYFVSEFSKNSKNRN